MACDTREFIQFPAGPSCKCCNAKRIFFSSVSRYGRSAIPVVRLVRNTRALGPSPVPENNLMSGNFPFDDTVAAATCAFDMVTGECIRVTGEGVLGGGVGVRG